MKHALKHTLCALGAALLLMLSACKQEEAIPVCPSLPEVPEETAPRQVAAWDDFPRVFLHYEDEDLHCSAELTRSDAFTWGATMEDGTRCIAEQSGARPYQLEQLCTLMMADTGGKVRLELFYEPITDDADYVAYHPATALPEMTLTCYPIDGDGNVSVHPDTAQTISVSDGSCILPAGQHYYELTVPQRGGQLTYGFVVNRLDKEKYEITWEQATPCLVEGISEDPDAYQKGFLPHITLYPNLSGNGGIRHELYRCRNGFWTYVNHAGTEVRITWTEEINIRDPRLFVMREEHLIGKYKFELLPRYAEALEKMTYTRYDHDGNLLEAETEITGNLITLLPESCYVITATFENGVFRYLQKTGEMILAPHPQDNHTLPAKTAYIIRSDFVDQMWRRKLTIGNVWIDQYLGVFGSCYFLYMGENTEYADTPRTVSVAEYEITLPGERPLYGYHLSRFYTLAEAYQEQLLDREDVYRIGLVLDPTFQARYPEPPLIEADKGD